MKTFRQFVEDTFQPKTVPIHAGGVTYNQNYDGAYYSTHGEGDHSVFCTYRDHGDGIHAHINVSGDAPDASVAEKNGLKDHIKKSVHEYMKHTEKPLSKITIQHEGKRHLNFVKSALK